MGTGKGRGEDRALGVVEHSGNFWGDIVSPKTKSGYSTAGLWHLGVQEAPSRTGDHVEKAEASEVGPRIVGRELGRLKWVSRSRKLGLRSDGRVSWSGSFRDETPGPVVGLGVLGWDSGS